MAPPSSWDELAKEVIGHPSFQAAFARFAEQITGPYIDANTERTLEFRRGSYTIGALALAHFLKDIGQLEIAVDYHELGEAFFDLSAALPHPLFTVPRRSGGQSDSSAVWRLRARICTGIRFLIAAGKEESAAVAYVVKSHGKDIKKLLRRADSDLQLSVETWLAKFEALEVGNGMALEDYKDNMERLRELMLANFPAKFFANLGQRKISDAAMQATRLP